MPLYMDRHDVPETVTAENVAHIHQEDLRLQDQFGCRVLTYWYDEKRKNAFCLIEAPNAMAIQELHNQAHGQIPNSIIEVSSGIVESFLGRIDDPDKSPDTELNIIDDSALRTIMVIDIKRLLPEPTYPDSYKASLQQYHKAILDLLNVYEGNLVKQTDAHFLVSFKSVSLAVHAALDIQKQFKELIPDPLNHHLQVKIGLSVGVPVTEKKQLFEETVKLAERMCKIMKGEVILSPEVKELYESENPDSLNGNKDIHYLSYSDEKFLTELLDYTEANWNNTELKIEDFSKPLGISKSQLYRKMISLTGTSPNNFVVNYRLNEAVHLLNKNSSNVTEIAYKTGFTSPSYFSKCFKKHFGHLPSDYLGARATS